jgi:hypothetical protein
MKETGMNPIKKVAAVYYISGFVTGCAAMPGILYLIFGRL